MVYSDAEKQQILNETLDPQKVMVFCQRHMYFGEVDKVPTSGCKGCWLTYYIHLIARTPEHLRAQRIQELEAIVHHMSEDVEAGKHDIDLFEHPVVTIEKKDN